MGEQAAPSNMAALTELIMKMRNEQLQGVRTWQG